MRDSQRSRVLAALTAMPEWDGPIIHFSDIVDFRDSLANRKVLRKKLRLERATRPSWYGSGKVTISDVTFKKWTKFRVLWAWTHDFLSQDEIHDAEYCRTLLMVVQNLMGKEVAGRLKAEFKKHKVKYRKPRKDVTNPKGNPQALRMYRLAKEIEGHSKSLFDMFDAEEVVG